MVWGGIECAQKFKTRNSMADLKTAIEGVNEDGYFPRLTNNLTHETIIHK